MKRGIILSALVLLVLTNFISAAPLTELTTAFQNVFDTLIEALRPIFEFIIGDYSSSEFFATKVLMLILLFLMINAILRRVNLFEDNNSVVVVIASIVSIIAIRFISDNQIILGILLPYGVLGVALLSSITFLLFFYFVQNSGVGSFGRRFLWAFYGIVYVIIYAFRFNEMSAEVNWIYGLTIGLIILMILFDRGLHRYFSSWELSRFYAGANQRTIAALQEEFLRLMPVPTPQANNRRNQIRRELRRLGAGLP